MSETLFGYRLLAVRWPAAIILAFLCLPAGAQERLSLSGLQAQIEAVDGDLQEVLAVLCGGRDLATCAADILPSVVDRVEELEAENQALKLSLCDLAAQTGSSLPECGPVDGDLRLVGGSVPTEGRVELFFAGQWGTVCDDLWDINDATVACRQLGFSGATEALLRAVFGQGTGPILLDNVLCTGTESRLIDCPAQPIGLHNCAHIEDAGVRCAP